MLLPREYIVMIHNVKYKATRTVGIGMDPTIIQVAFLESKKYSSILSLFSSNGKAS